MKVSARKHISRVLALTLTVGTVFSNFTGFEVFAAGKTIDVWDFGGLQESGSLYTNHINRDMLDKMEIVSDDEASGNKGKFLEAGDVSFNGITVNVVANDRLFYNGADGKRSYGTNGKAIWAYDDGYTADGMWYANGTGGEERRYLTLSDVKAGDGVTVYTGPSNTADLVVHFTGAGGDDVTGTIPSGEMARFDFVAKSSGEYKVWFGKDNSAKPVVNRIVKYPAVKVSGKIDLQGNQISGYSVSFKNKTTGDVVDAVVSGDTYTADLTPGYTYTATLSGAVGYGFTNKSKTVSIGREELDDKTADLLVEVKTTYKISGKISGFEEGYDISNFKVDLVPDEESMADTVPAELDENLNYSAVLEPDIDYTVVLNGVNDYEVKEGAVANSNTDLVQDIKVGEKPVYDVSGSFTGADAKVSELSFVNVDDDYSYGAAVTDNGYSIKLRDGSYLAVAKAENANTRTHVVVSGGAVTQDILFVSTAAAQTYEYSKDVYVGVPDKTPNFDTVSEAMAAVNTMGVKSEDQRITVHIAPGTYREQISVDTPYLTFVKEGEGDVVLTWYYGIGYKYYSAQTSGWYDEEDAFEKFGKNAVQKWGTGTFIKDTASGFRAEGITFESSFNKYVTDEEIADGVECADKLYLRRLGADVTSKDSTERSTAISVEGDNCEFKDCTFIGSQDTLYIGGKVTNDVYFKDCVIEGNTDYIFGSGDAVFDGCELRFAGYSDRAEGGYITAGRSNNYADYNGYLFRNCTITNKDGFKHTAGYFGRPWDAKASILFYNTKLENADAVTAEGWTEMSGTKPDVASFKEYNTTYAGQAVDTSGRISGTAQASISADPKTYFGTDWTPSFFVEEKGTPAFTVAPNLSSDGDILLPATGNTLKVVYDLGENAGTDASRVDWYTVAADGSEELVKTVSAIENEGLLITNSMLDKKIKAVITPILYSGASGQAVTLVTEKEVTPGSGYREADRPGGKSVIFLAGDSTVKDYSAGAINNSGANRSEGSWGEFFGDFIDSSNYEVMDYAEGGRSSRTFMDGTKADDSDRFLDKIKAQMVAGDYLFIQFGHNDSSASYTDRYVKTGDADADGKYPYTAPSADKAGDGTFAWYLQQYVDTAKEAGATPVLVTPVSRMYFNSDGTIYSHHGSNDEYVTITKQVAKDNDILCIDLYTMSKELYEKAYAEAGLSEAERLFAYGEKTHHSKLGGFALAAMMANYIEDNTDLGFAGSIKAPASLSSSDAKDNLEFNVWKDGVFEGYAKNAETGVYDEKLSEEYWTPYINGILEQIGGAAENIKYGDADGDGIIDASDSAVALQYALNSASVKIDPKSVDVDREAGVTANDAANILQKALVSTFKMPIERTA